MAEFLRPEARATLWRWREALAGAGLVALGGWWGLTAAALVVWLGWAICALGLGLMAAGVQRGRFRQSGDGPGVVQVIEGRVSYFGPLTGGAMDLDDITRLEWEPAALPAPHWVLTARDGAEVAIPANAAGSEALFDAFTRLPGLDASALLKVSQAAARVQVWRRFQRQLH